MYSFLKIAWGAKITLLIKKIFQEHQLNSRRFPGAISNSRKFPGFQAVPGVVDTLNMKNTDPAAGVTQEMAVEARRFAPVRGHLGCYTVLSRGVIQRRWSSLDARTHVWHPHQQQEEHRPSSGRQFKGGGQGPKVHSSPRPSQLRRSTEWTSCCELATVPVRHVETPDNHAPLTYDSTTV